MNENSNKLLLIAVSTLAGIVITGSGMVIRGDFLGERAADAVEMRSESRLRVHTESEALVNELILQELRYIRTQVDHP